MAEKSQLTENGACSSCGSSDLLLAKDMVEYVSVEKTEKGWVCGAASMEEMDDGDPMGNVRLFCSECGTYFDVPEDLP